MSVKESKTIIILFSRLSDYMLNMFQIYVNETGNNLVVFKKAPDKNEAPFNFNLKDMPITFFNENEFDTSLLIDMVDNFNPDVIICSGWSNSKYLNVVKRFNKNIDCVLTMDNQWLGSIRQRLGIIYSKLFIKPFFKKIWVAGLPQKQFALKLGFKSSDVFEGWYVANFNNFLVNVLSENKFNKRFVFVGRYIEVKGIKNLISAFIELKNEQPNNWQLHCIGIGDLQGKMEIHNDIIHHGFLQPNQLKYEASKGGVFCLPSHFEPWGLVVQEFALSGYPLIVSDRVGAASKFITKDNGYIVKPNNVQSLKTAMKNIINTSEINLVSMGRKSRKQGQMINSSNWVNTLNKIVG